MKAAMKDSAFWKNSSNRVVYMPAYSKLMYTIIFMCDVLVLPRTLLFPLITHLYKYPQIMPALQIPSNNAVTKLIIWHFNIGKNHDQLKIWIAHYNYNVVNFTTVLKQDCSA